jgi:hypothetical protein
MSFWDRVGAFASQVAHLGGDSPAAAGVDVAKSTSSNSEASAVGRAWNDAKAGTSSAFNNNGQSQLAQQQAQTNAFGKTGADVGKYQAAINPADENSTFGIAMAWADRYLWSPGNDAIETLSRAGDDFRENAARNGYGAAIGDLGSNFGDEWHTARTQNNTAGQIMEFTGGGGTVKVPLIGKDGQVHGYRTEQKRYWDNDTKRWVYPLLDDPSYQMSQDQYFKSGVRRWTTGVTDFVVSTATDPTLIAGKATKPLRAAREVLGAEDVASAYETSGLKKIATDAPDAPQKTLEAAGWADGVEPTPDLAKVATVTGKSRRLQKQTYSTAADFVHGLTSGHVAAEYAKNPLISQTSDSGAILAMMKHSVDLGGTKPEMIARAQRVLYAGAGSKSAYDDIAAESPLLGLEIDSLTAPNAAQARFDLYMQNLPHDQRLQILDDDDQMNRLKEAAQVLIDERIAELDRLNSSFESNLSRVEAVGTRGTGQFEGGVGEISKVQTPGLIGQRAVKNAFVGAAQKKMLGHAYSVQKSPYLPAIHFFTGVHMPNLIHLDGDDAIDKFNAYLYNAGKYARREKATDLIDTIKQASDEFLGAPTTATMQGAVGRDSRMAALKKVQQAYRDHLVDKWATKTGFSKDEIGTQIDDLLQRADSEHKHAIYRARQAVASDSPLVINDPDGIKVFPTDVRDQLAKMGGTDFNAAANQAAKAISSSQFQRVATLTNWNGLDRALRDLNSKGMLGPAMRASRVVGHGSAVTLDFLSDWWKFGVLFRPVAYMLRNQLDTQSRVEAELGPMFHGLVAARGMGNLAANLHRVPKIDVAQFQARIGLADLRDQAMDALEHGNLSDEVRASWKDAQDRAEAMLSLSPDDFRQQMLEQHRNAAGEIVTPEEWQGKTFRRSSAAKAIQGSRWRYGAGGQALESAEGKFAAYDGLPEFMQKNQLLDAENTFMGYFADHSAQDLAKGRLDRELTDRYPNLRYDARTPRTAKEWTNGYVTYVNHQLRNDPMNRMIMQGATDRDLYAWLKTGAGSDYWKAFKETGEDAEKWATPADLIQAQRATLDKVLPTIESRQTALSREITADDISATFRDDPRPAIPTAETRRITPKPPMVRFRDRYFNIFSTLPESMMGRHPLYMASFKDHVAQAVDRFGKEGVDNLTLDQVRAIRTRADALARRDVSRIVFDTTNKTPFSHATRWLFPFYGAWQDTLVKWARIQGDNPEAIPGLVHAFTIPSRVFQVQDQNGNIVRPSGDVMDPVTGQIVGKNFNPLDGAWVIPLPKALSEKFSGAKNVKINRNSLNVIFQGEPFWLPGPGPILTVGVQQVANRVMPEFGLDPAEFVNSPAARWATPFGLSDTNVTDAALPSWFKTAQEFFIHDQRWKDQFADEMYTISGQVARGEVPKMTAAEIQAQAENRTRNWFFLRLLGTQSPVSTIPDDALDFYKDRYHAYLNTYGPDARDKFMADYPEFGEATISTTVNQTGIQATIKAQKAADKYKNAIKANPKVGWAIVGPDNQAGYNQDVFTEQKALGWRTPQDPNEALDQAQADKGWQTYNAFITKMNAYMVANGLTSLRQNGAESVARAKQDFIDDLSRKNPAWKQSFASAGAGDSQVQFLDSMADTLKTYKGLGKREDMVQLQTYMAARAQMRQAMAAAGVHSLQTTTNPDGSTHYADTATGTLAQQWDAFYTDLYDKSSSVAKAMFDRARLGDDDLSNGVSN